MNNLYPALAAIFLVMGILSYIAGILVLSIIFIIIFIGLMFFVYRGTAMHVNKKVSNITYDGIMQTGISKIEKGTFYIEKDKFISVMGKINDIVSSQGNMPEFGLDALYLLVGSQEKAEKIVNEIKQRGIGASMMQERTSWKVKIEFS
ncbi:MAG: hypothetical protein QXZ44_01670 [Ferroplasma sp.]